MIKIVVDSASSITPEVAQSSPIHILPVQITFGDRNYLDGVDLDAAGFYQRLRASPDFPVTSQPSVGAYFNLFQELTADGSEVLCITLCSGLSGALTAAQTAREMLAERPIHVFDSWGSVGEALLTLAAAETAAEGRPAGAILARLEQLRARTRTYLVLDTLEYVRRGGRVSGVEALLGTMPSIKPVVHMVEGRLVVREKVRSKGRAVARMLELAGQEVGREAPVWCGVGGADCADEVLALEQKVAARFHCTRLWHAETGPTIATRGGPGVIGMAICPMA